MTREDRCGYRVERLERKSRRRRRGGTTGSGLAAERGQAFRESRPFLFPFRQGTARTANPRHAKNCRLRRFCCPRSCS